MAVVTNSNNDEFNIKGIAISAPGVVDSESGVIGGIIVKIGGYLEASNKSIDEIM